MKKLICLLSFTCLITIVKGQHPARPFNSGSPYNHRIRTNPILDPNATIAAKINASNAPIIQIYEYAPRIYYVNGNTERRIPVTCTYSNQWGTCELSTVSGGVPIPAGAQGAVGDDAHMVTWDTVNNISYEFWQYRYPNGTAPEGQTSWGGYVSTAGNGVDKPNTGGLGATFAPTGSSISRLAGIIRLDEVKAGVISHALVGPTNNSCNTFRWPALKSDGWSTRSDCIPEGAHIQLDPSINLNTVTGMRPIDKMIAKALQVYGWYNVDNGGVRTDGSSTKWVIQFEVDPTAYGLNCPAWGGTGNEPGATYCNAGFGGDYDGLRGTCQDGSSLFSHMRVLADGQVLPNTISKFHGEKHNTENILYIEIAESENIKSVLLERSNDGIHFTALRNVSETWKSINGAHVYADAQPLNANNFYRLNIIDNDGKQTVSGIVLLANNVSKISLYPNPFKNYVMLKADAGKYFVSVADVKGKNIYNNIFNTNGNDIKISLPGLAQGVYYIVLKNENGNIIQKEKIVKQ